MLKLYFYELKNNYAIFMINYDFSFKNIFLKRTCESRILGKKMGYDTPQQRASIDREKCPDPSTERKACTIYQ